MKTALFIVNMICFAKTFQLPISFKYCIILIQYRWNNIEEAKFNRCLLEIPLNEQVTSFSKPKWRQVLLPMFKQFLLEHDIKILSVHFS